MKKPTKKRMLTENEILLGGLELIVAARDFDSSAFAQKMITVYLNNHEWTFRQRECVRELVESRADRKTGKLKVRVVDRKKQAFKRGFTAAKNCTPKGENFYDFLGKANKELREQWNDGWETAKQKGLG